MAGFVYFGRNLSKQWEASKDEITATILHPTGRSQVLSCWLLAWLSGGGPWRRSSQGLMLDVEI